MLTDIEIAQQAKMKKITEIAANLGIEEDEVEQYGHYKAKLNQKLGKSTKAFHDNEENQGGIALVNVNNRIQLIFGDEYGMHVYSVPGEGTDVEITIPILTDDRQVKNRSVLA